MYDKSKKTWSQRLKITKTEKSTTATNDTITSAAITTTNTRTESFATVTAATPTDTTVTTRTRRTTTKTQPDVTYNVNNIGRCPTPQYRTVATKMHLPTLQLSDYHIGNGVVGVGANNGYEYLPSSLSRSMKYAEPWIYGTVRGIPARPSFQHYLPQASTTASNYIHPHAAAIFATHPGTAEALAVVICSCPEYLNGTKRDVKKASVCKKCKGSRLPLAPIGGTMRLPPSGMLAISKLRSSGAATLRVVSTSKKARPTILDAQADPYDLMRRTRLLSPEPGVTGGSINNGRKTCSGREKEKVRGRGKSVSPVRGRSRKRLELPASSKKQNNIGCDAIDKTDCWLVEETHKLQNISDTTAAAKRGERNAARRSILRCNMNPYDLISINVASSATNLNKSPAVRNKLSSSNTSSAAPASQMEFAPQNDDFNVEDAALTEEAPPFASNLRAGSMCMKTTGANNATQSQPSAATKTDTKTAVRRAESRKDGPTNVNASTSEEDATSSHDEEIHSKRNYNNVQAIAGQRISLGGSKSTTKALIKQSEDGRNYESIIIAESVERTFSKQQLKRTADEQQRSGNNSAPTASILAEPKRPPRTRKRDSSESAKSAESETELALPKYECDKSLTTASDSERVTVLTVTPTQRIKSILKRPPSRTAENIVDAMSAEDQQQTALAANGNNDGPTSITSTNQRRTNSTSSIITISPSPTAKSQFYIPLPQARKKVQFRVEERIVHALESDATSSDEIFEMDEAEEVAANKEKGIDEGGVGRATNKSTSNYEYYNRKREQQRLYRVENIHESATATAITSGRISPDGEAAESSSYDSDFVAQVIAKVMSVNNNNNHTNNNDHDDHDDDDDNTATEMGSSNVNSSNSMHYEDIAPVTIGENKNNSSSSKQHCDDSGKIMPIATTKMLLTQQEIVKSAPSTTTAEEATAASSSTSTMAATATIVPSLVAAAAEAETVESMPHVTRNDDDDDESDEAINDNSNNDAGNIVKDMDEDAHDDNNTLARKAALDSDANAAAANVKHGGTAANNGATAAVRGVHCVMRHNDEEHNSNNNNISNTNTYKVGQPQATQSRNHIRRSQSERHPPTTIITMRNNGNNTSSNTNNRPHHNQQQGGHTINGDLRIAAISSADSSSCNQHSNSSANNETNGKSPRVDAILSFKDTMALRPKQHRNDSRDLFTRPREPPPPPPTPPPPNDGTSVGATDTAAAAQTTPTAVNVNRTDNNRIATTLATKDSRVVALIAALTLPTTTQKRQTNIVTLSPVAATKQLPTDKAKNASATKNAEISKVCTNGLDKHQQQQEQRVADVKVQKHAAHKSPTDSAHCGMQQMAKQNIHETGGQQQERQKHPRAQQQCGHNASETVIRAIVTPHSSSLSTSVDGFNSTRNSPQQRTIVRVAPFNQTKTTSEIHRLKISHTDDENAYSPQYIHPQPQQSFTSPHYSFRYNANGSTFASDAVDLAAMTTQKKTSILINGDDCYSTMNLSCDDASTPLYHSSVVVADYSATKTVADSATDVEQHNSSDFSGLKVTTTSNTVTINVSSPRTAAEELIYQHNKINTLLSRQAQPGGETISVGARAIIPIKGSTEVNLQRSASSTSSTSTSSMTSLSSSGSNSGDGSSSSTPKRGRTLIRLDYVKEKPPFAQNQQQQDIKLNLEIPLSIPAEVSAQVEEPAHELLSHEEELLKILRNPVEAVKRNLVPHICGRKEMTTEQDTIRNRKMKDTSKQNVDNEDVSPMLIELSTETPKPATTTSCKDCTPSIFSKSSERHSFITKLLEDPTLSQVADGLETETVAELIENSLKRLQESRNAVDMSGTKDNDDMNRLINISLQKIKEERLLATITPPSYAPTPPSNAHLTVPPKEEDGLSNRGSISSANSFASANNYEMFDFDANESDCYQSCSSEITSPGDDDGSSTATRSKFYQMLVDATLAEIEMSTNLEEDTGSHHYESIRHNCDPIYEEINDVPPPLPLTAPPVNDSELEKKATRSIFEGASKYDILSYLVDAKERGVVREEPFDYPLNCTNPIIIEEEACDTLSDLGKRHLLRDISSHASILSDSSEDTHSIMSSLSPPANTFICGSGGSISGSSTTGLLQRNKGASSDIERNDSGVGSETSKCSRSKYQSPLPTVSAQFSNNSPVHLCEDCDGPVETQVTDSGIMFAPLVCRKCGKKRVERKEIITEIVETEEKYGRDLQIILEEFCQPMLVAGLLTQEQLSAIFLNAEELLENNQTLAERMRDALDIALEQGDDDLLTVNIGKIFLDFTQMLHAFESYCVRQAGASLLLANLEKEKELLRIFLKVSQMENAVLRRMNLNSFLMVPVQRVTKYPLLLARLYKVTPGHLEGRDQLKQAQEKIELHLNHINQEAKDVPTKLWRRISSSSPNRRASCEIDMINIKLRKMAIDILEWNHDEVRFAMEGKLLYTQPTDSNWKKARTIKLTPVNALLVTNGKPSANYKAEKVMSDKLNFPKHTGIREASLLVVKEKCGRYTLLREPLYLDRCVVCSEADWDDYFEVQEISSKDTFIFKAEDGVRTKQWYTQLQYHAQGMGAWRKRRNALANIMINGMLTRT